MFFKVGKLTRREKAFCKEYVVDFNGTQAAMRAGYSKRTARGQASQMMNKPRIQEELNRVINKMAERNEITQDMVLKELIRLGYSDVSNYVEWGGSSYKLKESAQLTKEQTAAISEVSVHKSRDGGSIRFKLHDKKGALELLGKHLGMFVERFEGKIALGTWDELEKEIAKEGAAGKK